MKGGNTAPLKKETNRTNKENYRQISILSNVSKVFEKCMYKNMSYVFKNLFSKCQCGFRRD